MYKNQLQELAQRSCFNLPSYTCIREGPDHASRFKATVKFNGEVFDTPGYCTTLRQAEHAAAGAALNALSTRGGPSKSLTARVLDETGVYKNLLQETAHRAGLKLPLYVTVRSGPDHVPVFTSTVELASMNFTGEPAKTKKQAEKNAAIAALSSLKRMPYSGSLSQTRQEADNSDEQDLARGLGPKLEAKPIRRDHCQPKRRMMPKNPMDYGHINNSMLQLQVKLLNSKILPANSTASSTPLRQTMTSPNQLGIVGGLPAKNQEMPSRLEMHQGSSSIHGKNPICNGIRFEVNNLAGNPLKNNNCGSARMEEHIGKKSLVIDPTASPIRDLLCRQQMFIQTDGQKIAPAVQVRSVIPVCAAAPRPQLMRTQPLSCPLLKEAAHSKSTAAEGAEVSNRLE